MPRTDSRSLRKRLLAAVLMPVPGLRAAIAWRNPCCAWRPSRSPACRRRRSRCGWCGCRTFTLPGRSIHRRGSRRWQSTLVPGKPAPGAGWGGRPL